MAYPQQDVAVEIFGEFKLYRIIGFHDNAVSISIPSMSTRAAGTLTVQVRLDSGQDRDDAARIAVLTHSYGNSTDTTATLQSAAALERCKPDRMQEVLIKTLHFLCRASLEGVGPVSGLSVLCNVKGSKEQVFRALLLLTSQQSLWQKVQDPVVSMFDRRGSANRMLGDETYQVTDLLWAMDRLRMLYDLAQRSA
jgi:hypothetical protein